MKNLWMLSGRRHRRRTSGRGALLRHPACGSLIYLLTYTSILPALTVSCIRAEEPAASDITEVTEPAAADTVRTFLTILPDCDWGDVKEIDVLIYESGGLGLLEKHVEASGDARDMELMLEAGTKECVVIANSSRSLDLKILERYDTMQSLTFALKDEDTAFPVMAAHITMDAGTRNLVTVTPFLCRVIVEQVSNAMDRWVLMEEPQVFLSEINAEVGILQETEFRPAVTQEEGAHAALPCDIGFYTQHPGTVLFCYPNDTPERILGGSRCMVTFRCKVEGVEYEKTEPLPPMGKNGAAGVKVDMSEERELTVRIGTYR